MPGDSRACLTTLQQDGWWWGRDPVRSTGFPREELSVGHRTPTHSSAEKGPRVKMNDPTGTLHTVMGPTGSFYRSPDQI